MRTGGPSAGEAAEEAPKVPTITYEPSDATAEVVPTGGVGVKVADGWFQKVSLTNTSTGKVVAGVLNKDRNAYTITESLGYGASYKWAGSAVGEDGKAVPLSGTFTTVAPTTEVSGRFQLADGQTVGVAAPIILQFDSAIAEDDRAEVEKALKVTTTPPVESTRAHSR